MSKRKWRVAVAGVAVTATVLLLLLLLPAPGRSIELEVKGTPGLQVEGTCDFDGMHTRLSGTVPFNARYRRVRSLAFHLAGTRGSGDLTVAMHVDGKPNASATATAPRQGVRGHVHSGRMGGLFGANSLGIGTFMPEPRPR